ncbi:class I SAM-dependent methyltransferase [Nannocystaceae bacterium ST9]
MSELLDLDAANADLYESFTRVHERFGATSRALAALVGDLGDAEVVDLGCGTGVLTRELLTSHAESGRSPRAILGLDCSPAMLDHARRNVDDPRVRFVCGRAELLDRIIEGPVDAVLCNAAIWAMDVEEVASAVARVLRPGGRFAFNHVHAEPPSTDLHSIMRSLAHEQSIPLANARPLAPRRELLSALAERRMTLVRAIETTVDESVASQWDFLRLPGSTFRSLPGVPYPERLRLLEQAWARAGERREQPVRWIHVLMEKS